MVDIVRRTRAQFGEINVRKHFMSAPKFWEKKAGNIGRKKNSIYACVVKNYDFLKVKTPPCKVCVLCHGTCHLQLAEIGYTSAMRENLRAHRAGFVTQVNV